MNHYERLGINNKDTSASDIKAAYRKMAMKYHPDRNDADTQEEFKLINEAFTILGDEYKKATYDISIKMGFKSNRYDNFSGSGFDNDHKNHTVRNTRLTFQKNDILYIDVDFSTVILGVENKKISHQYKHECHNCEGSGGGYVHCMICSGTGTIKRTEGFTSINMHCSVCDGIGSTLISACVACNAVGYIDKDEDLEITIPEGFDPRTKLFVKGKGNITNGDRGDLTIEVSVIDNQQYKRKGNNIIMEIPVNIVDIILENTITVPTLRDDIPIDLTHTSLDDDIVKSHLGTKTVYGTVYGDLIVKIKPFFPSFTEIQKEALKALL